MSMPYYNDQALLKSIREEDPAPVYLIYGRETYYSSVCLQKLLAKLVKKGTESFNFRKFDGTGVDMVAVRTECESLPLMADYKCVLIQNPNLEKLPAADLETLTEIMDDPNPTTVLILYVSAYDLNPKKNARLKKLMEQIARVGIVADIQPKSQAELIRLIRQKCQKAGCSIDQVTASILIDRCGTAMETLMRETDKLIAYRVQGEITRADVELVTHKSLEASIFDLSKAMLGGGGRTRAFQILNDLFIQREEPSRILSVLSGSFIDLYRAKAAHNAGKTANDLLSVYTYGKRAFLVNNAFRDVPRYSMRMLRGSLNILMQTELAMKSGHGEDRILVEEAVAQILALKEEG